MYFVEFVLTPQIFKQFVIIMNDKFFENEVMFPSLKGPHKYIELFIIGGIVGGGTM